MEKLTNAVETLIKAFGMLAENQFRMGCDKQIAYGEDAFQILLAELKEKNDKIDKDQLEIDKIHLQCITSLGGR